jgi:hypothetical protein
MATWKTTLVAAVVILAWFFAHHYFDWIAFIAGGLWVTEFFRSRAQGEGQRRAVSIEPLASALGIPVRANQRTVKFRWNGVVIHLSAHDETIGVRTVTIYDIASPAFRKAPFCFVVRPRKAKVREADLVENSRIPGIKFEYQLRRSELPEPLEAAANLPDLFADVMAAGNGHEIVKWGEPAAQVQKVFFNGRVVHTVALADETAPREQLAPLLDSHVAFHLNMLDLMDDVDFKVPM